MVGSGLPEASRHCAKSYSESSEAEPGYDLWENQDVRQNILNAAQSSVTALSACEGNLVKCFSNRFLNGLNPEWA